MISVNNLTITAGSTTLVDAVSFALAPGQRLGIIGESGSGKSMTALALMGLVPQSVEASGEVLVDKHNMLNAPERTKRGLRGRRIAMIFQEPMTALDPLMPVGKQVSRDAARADELLADVGITRAGAYPHELSGGQRQRVLIAKALAGDPDLLICDEPTTALDTTTQAQVLDLIDRLVAERGMALLFISHDLAVVRRMTQRVLIMQRGRIVAPDSDYAQALLAASRPGPPAVARPLGEPVIQLAGVSLHRGGTLAVDDVTLTVRRGQRLGLVGGSGSGKTSLLRLIAGLDQPDSGTVRVDGRLQMVFQDPAGSLNPRLRVGRSIAEACASRGERVAEVLEQVGLPGVAERFPHEFSGGQRQRISIARAAAPRPDILLADEPVSALDVTVRAQVLGLLNSLVDDDGLTLVFVSHDLSVVRAVCPTLAVIHEGRIVEAGATEAIWANPRHEYTRRLLAAVPS
ncbi:ATP-binding cassette domain-containing protein [Corynebacterium cystitidis]|uniref:ATP-binding cassette domain-containing protein n=1 Tax=Corynebacterium cystitidis TaxID=35757 RepID=UPI00211EE82D|nr:ABC transporter ATP-binding protein [Corynebacterium cystitidis]